MKEKNREIEAIRDVLLKFRQEGKVLIALLYGSYAKGNTHCRSDIDLALYLNPRDDEEEMEITDAIIMAADRDVSILRLDDEEESPFIVQEALKGVHLVEPDQDTLYAVSHRTLHECEKIRFRRGGR